MNTMYKDSISETARDALADLFMLKIFAKEEKMCLEDALGTLLDSFSEDYWTEYVEGLYELNEKGYISFKMTEDNETGNGEKVEKIQIRVLGKLYKAKCFDQDNSYSIKYNERALTADDLLKKIANGGIFILITAAISAISTVIDTFINVYNTFR